MVTGGDGGWGNLGDELLLQATREFYRPYLEHFDVVVVMARPPADLDDGFIYVGDDLKRFAALEIDAGSVALLHYYGGGYLNDYWYEGKIWLYRHLVARGLDPTRVAFTGQGVGPVGEDVAREIARCARAALVFGTRDHSTIEDAVFSFDDSIALLGSETTLPPERHAWDGSVALNFRLEHYVGFDDDASRALIGTVERYVAAASTTGLAFGMVQHPGFDEGAQIERVLDSVGAECVRFVPRPATYGELFERLAGCRATVTTSYHVALVSLYAGTPVVAVCASDYYRLKFDGLAQVVDSPLLAVVEAEHFDGTAIGRVLAAGRDAGLSSRLAERLGKLRRANADAHEVIARSLGETGAPAARGAAGSWWRRPWLR